MQKLIEDESFTAIPLEEGDALPSAFRIFKTGENESSKGTFVYDDTARDAVMAEWKRQGADLHVDWEHAALSDERVPKPAAAWFDLEHRDDGLYAVNVRWTPKAKEQLTNREYRYFSPAFAHDEKTRRVQRLVNLALTNRPGLRSLPALTAASEADLQSKDKPMKTLLVALGLNEDAAEAEALSATTQLSDLKREIVALTERQSPAEALGVLRAWKASNENVTKLAEDLTAARAEIEKRDIATLIADASKAGKVTPAMATKLTEQAPRIGLVALTALVETLPVLPGQGAPMKANEDVPSIAVAELTADDIEVAKQLGTDLEQLKAHKAKKIQKAAQS